MLRLFNFIIVCLLLTIGSGTWLISPAFAITTPSFPSCPTPGGELKVKYDTGSHAIVGYNTLFYGSDAVYYTSPTQLVQCYCSTDLSSGIQTNWWKFGDLSQDDITSLKNDNWYLIPDGTSWGLDSAPYLAKNSNFSCGSTGTTSSSSLSAPGPGSPPVCDSAVPAAPSLVSVDKKGSSATLTWTKVENATHYMIFYGVDPGHYVYSVPNTGNVSSFTINSLDPNSKYYYDVRAVNNCMPSASVAVGGQVLGATYFAPTGNVLYLITFGGLGIISLGTYLLVQRKNREI